MTIIIDISPEKERKLTERARNRGLDLPSYVDSLIDRDIQPSRPLIDEILTPVRKEFAASGMTDDQLDSLVEEAREESWVERHGAKN